MSLFLKIFLWFLLAMAAITGVSIFVSWSTQSEPIRERWRQSLGRAITVYADTAKQIYDNEGEVGAKQFIKTIENTYQNRNVCLTSDISQPCFNGAGGTTVTELVERALASEAVEFASSAQDESFGAKKFTTSTGTRIVLVLRVEIPRAPTPFGHDWSTRLIRIGAILLTAGLVCYGLVLYLVSPILKLRDATKQLAGGNLQTRLGSKRRDELGKLSRDFDAMAERIEALISSQSRLTRDISHELRSPLARMNVALELARSKASADTAPLLSRIETESQRLNEMISNILTLSKLESQSEVVEKDDLNLTRIFEGTVADAAFEAEGKGKSVVMLKADAARIRGNERLVNSAIENVMRNAVRYTPDKVDVSLEVREGKAFIKVRDYGEGIPEEDIGEIFRPFYRVSQARDRKSGGIGLGLSITEQAVNAHGGSVSAWNLEDGFVVEIKLPLNDARQ